MGISLSHNPRAMFQLGRTIGTISRMTSVNLIRRLFEHLRWVNARLCIACRPLRVDQLSRRFEIGQGTVLAKITHLYAAEFVWLEAVDGNATPISPFDIHFDSVAELEKAWGALEPR